MIKTYIPEDFHGACSWQSPSNIALVKYWGKRAPQLPMNPSISFTLSECRTTMRTVFEASERFSLGFTFGGKPNEAFAEKIRKFIEAHKDAFPFVDNLSLNIDSSNTFPHSSGIASSASSMSALVMALLDIERSLNGGEIDVRKASYFARLASGSASRSVINKIALWGRTDAIEGSSDEYAVDIHDIAAPVFHTYRDSILIVSDDKKSISSTAGHRLMDGNPFAEVRYREANNNILLLLKAFKEADLQLFMDVVESEAMQLHAMMMCSKPYFLLVKPNTIHIINKVRQFRADTHIPLCFTLDAGPNVHLLYPDEHYAAVKQFVETELQADIPNLKHIDDKVGDGASRI